MASPPDDGPCEVTITAPDREWLQHFVRQLVEDRLAAAAHLDTMHTTYRWKGQVHRTQEARAVLHTRLYRTQEIDARVQQAHPFEVACSVYSAIDGGNSAYLRWVIEEST